MKDRKGQQFGEWTIINYVSKINGMTRVLCKCSCGVEKELYLKHLKSGASKSCGHNKKEKMKKIGKQNLKYSNVNVADTRIYSIWYSMKQRCFNNNNPAYFRYGSRGITVCDEWKNDFMSFYNWAMENGYREDLTIDRINNNGNYEPNNCRWVTYKEQANNRRKEKTSRYLTYKSKTQTVKEWCKEYNIKYSTLSCRVNKMKLSDEEALKKFVKGEK